MYCVVYEFHVKTDKIDEFLKAWSEFTEAIYRVCGSLGSRLHKTDDPLVYVAYAQWPSKEVFEADIPETAYSPSELAAKAAMKSSVTNVKKVYFLDMVDDHFKR